MDVDNLAAWCKSSRNPKQQIQYLRDLCRSSLLKYVDEDAFADFVVREVLSNDEEDQDKKVIRAYYYLIINSAVLRICNGAQCSNATSVSLPLKHLIKEVTSNCDRNSSNPNQDVSFQSCLAYKYTSILVTLLCSNDVDDTSKSYFCKVRSLILSAASHLEYPNFKAKKSGLFTVFNNKEDVDEKANEQSLQHWNAVFSSLRRVLLKPIQREDAQLLISKEFLDHLYLPLIKFAASSGKNNVPLSLVRNGVSILAIISSNLYYLWCYKEGAGACLNTFISTFKLKIVQLDYFQVDLHVTMSLLQTIHGCVHSDYKYSKAPYVANSNVLELINVYVLPLLKNTKSLTAVTPHV